MENKTHWPKRRLPSRKIIVYSWIRFWSVCRKFSCLLWSLGKKVIGRDKYEGNRKKYDPESLLGHSIFWDWKKESNSRVLQSSQKKNSGYAIIICFYIGKEEEVPKTLV